MMTMRQLFRGTGISACVVLAVGCGGAASSGGGGGTTPTPPPVTPLLQVTTTGIPPALVGTPYSVQLTASNGVGSLKWTALDLLPAGLTLSATGLLSGTPSTAMCDLAVRVNVTDSSTPAQVAGSAFPFSAAGLSPNGTQGQMGTFFHGGVSFYCATLPVSWTLISGMLPPGVNLVPFPTDSSQLQFLGLPTQAGTYPFVVKAVDGSGRTAQQSTSVLIVPALLSSVDVAMQLGVVGRPFKHVVPLTGGTAPYTFTVSEGALAPGLQLNAATGEISGTPTTAGYSQFNISVSDSQTPYSYNLTKAYMLLVTAAPLTGRNDTLATATPIAEGSYIGSLSPYTDTSGTPAPDEDYYTATVKGGQTYSAGVSTGFRRGSWDRCTTVVSRGRTR